MHTLLEWARRESGHREKKKNRDARYRTNRVAQGEPQGVQRDTDGFVPRWSGCGFDVWLGQKHWRRPCYNPRVHTHKVSRPCVSADAS